MMLPNAETLLITLAEQIQSVLQPNTALVGLYSGGAWITERLIPMLTAVQGTDNTQGSAVESSAIKGSAIESSAVKSSAIENFAMKGSVVAIEHGVLDSAFYRDDYSKRGLRAEPKPSHIPFEVNDRHIILIDDVFYTGRTIRAAMNELFDYGRPASITLAVMVNRGGRELPIAPQITAYECQLSAQQNLQLLRNEDGTFYLTLEGKP